MMCVSAAARARDERHRTEECRAMMGERKKKKREVMSCVRIQVLKWMGKGEEGKRMGVEWNEERRLVWRGEGMGNGEWGIT